MATNPQNKTNDSTTVPTSQLRNRLYRLGKPVRDFLLFSSAYLALIAMAEVLIVTKLLSLPLSPAVLVAGLLTFAVYGNDRVADVETDEKTAPGRAAFVKRYNRMLYALSALAYGLAVALAVLGGPAAFALALLPGVVWIVYAQDWLPSFGQVKRLKQVFILNSVLVAGAWALVIVFLPIAFAGAAITPAAGVVFVFFFLAAFISVEVPNVRDLAGDREIGVKTLPVVLGIRGTRYFLYSVAGLGVAIVATAYVTDILGWAAAAGLMLSLVILLGITVCLGRTDNNSALTITAECSRLPMLALVIVPLL
ncbi:UbiA family prenyltransferase [Haloarcula sp. S1CR25-12]|uniref:UbiA family prenyltransferase n=1 Tax=Haloarcula saliterrae TaxID=2950534 RepID=A0ABU2FBW6_9EURY|nr:UbiA family prenyltransferase [Haloarcula sp. S1CR25-12]MDS0259763.1 UbiA family prenyltransferase [Haloarcula sp. S1CR25-12]